MKKKMLFYAFVFIITIVNVQMNVFAAPKVMSDGEIFDSDYYAQNNPDVVAVFGKEELALYNHYLLYGKKEGRKPYEKYMQTVEKETELPSKEVFDPQYYANANPDVVAVFGMNEKALYNHYITYGKAEGRKGVDDKGEIDLSPNLSVVKNPAAITTIRVICFKCGYSEDTAWTTAYDNGKVVYNPPLPFVYIPGEENGIKDTYNIVTYCKKCHISANYGGTVGKNENVNWISDSPRDGIYDTNGSTDGLLICY